MSTVSGFPARAGDEVVEVVGVLAMAQCAEHELIIAACGLAG